MTASWLYSKRCAAGVCCIEVSARLTAADLGEYQLGLVEQARQLRTTAERIAESHGYGNVNDDRRNDEP